MSRGRVGSDFNRNLVHLGFATCSFSERHDEAADRGAVREILAGLLLQDVPAPTIRRIRQRLRTAIALGNAVDRAEVRKLAGRLAGWYDSAAAGDLDSLAETFDEILAEIETVAVDESGDNEPLLTNV